MITEKVQVFWAELQRGEFISDAAVVAGTYRKQGTRWVIANGGVRARFAAKEGLFPFGTRRSFRRRAPSGSRPVTWLPSRRQRTAPM
jgi:hypothetical protein